MTYIAFIVIRQALFFFLTTFDAQFILNMHYISSLKQKRPALSLR